MARRVKGQMICGGNTEGLDMMLREDGGSICDSVEQPR